MGGEPTFSHVNGFKWVNSPSRAKWCHAEHAHADISVRWEGQLIITRLTFFPCRRAVELARGEDALGPRTNFSPYKQGLRVKRGRGGDEGDGGWWSDWRHPFGIINIFYLEIGGNISETMTFLMLVSSKPPQTAENKWRKSQGKELEGI